MLDRVIAVVWKTQTSKLQTSDLENSDRENSDLETSDPLKNELQTQFYMNGYISSR